MINKLLFLEITSQPLSNVKAKQVCIVSIDQRNLQIRATEILRQKMA